MQKAVTNPITNKLWWEQKIWRISIPVMSQIMILYLRRCYMWFLMEVRPLPSVNKREARYKIRDCVRQRQSEWKRALKTTQKMGKGLHKVFSTVVKDIPKEMTSLVESGSEVSHFIPESNFFSEVTKLSKNIKKHWLKATLKEIKNLMNNRVNCGLTDGLWITCHRLIRYGTHSCQVWHT